MHLQHTMYIASIFSAGFGSQTNLHLCSAVADFNSVVPPDKALQIDSLLSAPSVSQIELSCTLDTHMFYRLLEASSTADRARLLSVSSPHASSWMSVVPSQGLGLDMDTPHGSQCALYPGNAFDPLGHHTITCNMGMMLWHDTTSHVMFWLKCACSIYFRLRPTLVRSCARALVSRTKHICNRMG